ncbi:MAG: hypothetical protein MJE68_32775, partial [Proteobacteria bacterium]|nr:hypothetical protein [Pseudomonadota bacterium]
KSYALLNHAYGAQVIAIGMTKFYSMNLPALTVEGSPCREYRLAEIIYRCWFKVIGSLQQI